MPPYLAEDYNAAVLHFSECVALHRNEDWDEPTLLSAFSAQAVAKRHHRVAEAIMNLDDYLIGKLIDLNFGDKP